MSEHNIELTTELKRFENGQISPVHVIISNLQELSKMFHRIDRDGDKIIYRRDIVYFITKKFKLKASDNWKLKIKGRLYVKKVKWWFQSDESESGSNRG